MADLDFSDVSIEYDHERAVDHVNLSIETGTCVAIVGESGSGKSTLLKAAFGMLPGATVTGSIQLLGQDTLRLDPAVWRQLRGTQVSMIFQNPSAYLNPHRTVGNHFKDVFRAHGESYDIERAVPAR